MQQAETKTATFDARSSDMHLVSRAIANDRHAFRTIMQRNNQRLYRIARGVVRDDFEAEDVVQEAYVQAFSCSGVLATAAGWFTPLLRRRSHPQWIWILFGTPCAAHSSAAKLVT